MHLTDELIDDVIYDLLTSSRPRLLSPIPGSGYCPSTTLTSGVMTFDDGQFMPTDTPAWRFLGQDMPRTQLKTGYQTIALHGYGPGVDLSWDAIRRYPIDDILPDLLADPLPLSISARTARRARRPVRRIKMPVPEEQLAAAVRSEHAFVHYSRCMLCGRRTPHEMCKAHAESTLWPADVDTLWNTGVDLPPETCEVENCADCL